MKQAVILAGGAGILMRPLSFTMPKTLLPLMNRPVIDYILAIMKNAGFEHIILTTEHMSESLETYLKENSPELRIDIHRVRAFKGTAHILLEIEEKLQDTFLVLNGDCIFDLDLQPIIDYFERNDCDLGLIVRPYDDHLGKRFFIIENDRLTDIAKEPHTHQDSYSDTLIYLLSKRSLNWIVQDEYFDIHVQLIDTSFQQKAKISIHKTDSFWAVLGHIYTYLAANFWVLQNYNCKGYVAPGSSIDPTAKLIPPYLIEEDCQIDADCILGPNVIIGKNVSIGSNCRIDNSLIFSFCSLSSGCGISESVISYNSTIGRDTVLKPLNIIKNHCDIGEKSVLGEGARVGPHIILEDNSNVSDFIFPISILGKTNNTGKIYSASDQLDSQECNICFILQKSGGLSIEGICSNLNLEKSAIEKKIKHLCDTGIVVSQISNPEIYSLKT